MENSTGCNRLQGPLSKCRRTDGTNSITSTADTAGNETILLVSFLNSKSRVSEFCIPCNGNTLIPGAMLFIKILESNDTLLSQALASNVS